jgi:hypothetical protein
LASGRRASLGLRAAAVLLGALASAGCPAAPRPRVPPDLEPRSPFRVFAEGPCARLSLQQLAGRRLLVYGDTGYDLHDWRVSERLAAAQSFVEVRGDTAYRVPALYESLPSNSGGYVPFDLRFGGGASHPWLLAVDTRYASRGAGALFEREARAFVLAGERWQATPPAAAITLPDAARSLPPLPVETMCTAAGGPGLTFVPLASTTLRPAAAAAGDAAAHVFVAGRCQDASHINHRGTTILVAHGAPGAEAWRVAGTPDAAVLDGIVNLGLYARAADDVYLVAWEPFVPPDARQPYLVRYDGAGWSGVETGLPEGLMSVSGTADGALWLAAGRGLYLRPPRAATFHAVPLPPLQFATEPHPPTLRVHTVQALSPEEVWVEATYRVGLNRYPTTTEARASVLFRLGDATAAGAVAPVLYCDARERAELALSVVEPR